MKRIISSIVVLLMVLTVDAKMRDDAFIIYCNDGTHLGFVFSEVTKIGYSQTDLNGDVHKEFVTHEVYTADSVYRIPVSMIDSVSFEKPSVVYQPNVVRDEETHIFDYLVSMKDMTLTFKSDMPSSLKPKEGQVLVCFDDSHTAHGGSFGGKVQKVSESSDGIIAVCDSLEDITDVYERLIGVETISDEDTTGSRTRVAGEYKDKLSLNFNPSMEIEDEKHHLKLNTHLGMQAELDVKVVYDITMSHKYLAATVIHEWQPSMGYTVYRDSSADVLDTEKQLMKTFGDPYAPIIMITFPQAPALYITVGGAPFCSINGSIELSQEVSFKKQRFHTMFIYNNGEYMHRNKNLANEEDDEPLMTTEGKFSIKGSAQVGLCVGTFIGAKSIFKAKLGALTTINMGPQISGELSFKLSDSGDNLNMYKRLKDTKIDFCPFAVNVTMEATAGLGDKVAKAKFFDGSLSVEPWSLNLFPEFTKPSCDLKSVDAIDQWGDKITKKVVNSHSKVSGQLLIPVTPGFMIYDSNGNLVNTLYRNDYYWGPVWGNENHNVNLDFDNWKLNEEYKIYPSFSFLGVEVKASPYNTFKKTATLSTFDATEITNMYARLHGKVDESFFDLSDYHSSGFILDTSIDSLKAAEKSSLPSSTRNISNFGDKETNLKLLAYNLMSETTYYYRVYVATSCGEYYFGDIKSFKTEPTIPVAVDLGLPSGNKWCDMNLGEMNTPHRTGYYYQEFGSWTDELSKLNALTGKTWRVPTKEDYDELFEYCSHSGDSGYTFPTPLQVRGKGQDYIGNYIDFNVDYDEDNPSSSYNSYTHTSYMLYWTTDPYYITYTDEDGVEHEERKGYYFMSNENGGRVMYSDDGNTYRRRVVRLITND